jgi:hypothetical protein
MKGFVQSISQNKVKSEDMLKAKIFRLKKPEANKQNRSNFRK